MQNHGRELLLFPTVLSKAAEAVDSLWQVHTVVIPIHKTAKMALLLGRS